MIIVLVDWYVDETKVGEFLKYWREQLPIHNRNGLIGEFLSEPVAMNYKPWVTWDMPQENVKEESDGNFVRIVNVGLWEDEKSFEEEVARYIDDKNSPAKAFEMRDPKRQRTMLKPLEWRIGEAKLPTLDSGGVF